MRSSALIKGTVKTKIDIKTLLCFLSVGAFIVFGNSLTINLGERMPIKMSEILMTICLLTLIPKYYVLKRNYISKSIYIFLAIGAFSSLINTLYYDFGITSFIYSQLYTLRIIFFLMVASRIALHLKNNAIGIDDIFSFVISAYTVVGVFGFFQLYKYPIARDFYRMLNSYGLYMTIGDPHINRMFSTYLDPNFFACCLLIPTVLCLNNIIFLHKKKHIIPLLIFISNILLSNSRVGMIGLALAFIFLFFYHLVVQHNRSRKVMLKMLLLCTASMSFVLYLYLSESSIITRFSNLSQDKSFLARFISWREGTTMFRDNPFLGIGFNNIGVYKEKIHHTFLNAGADYGVDASALMILATTGIVGATYFILLYAKAFLHFLFKGQYSMYNYVYLTLFVLMAICSNTINLLLYPLWIMPIFFIFNVFYYYEYSRKQDSKSLSMGVIT